MKMLDKNCKNIYYWEFQCNGLTAYVASSNRGAVRVKIGFSRDQSFFTQLKSFLPKSELFEDRKHNEGLIKVIENYLRGDNQSIDLPWDINTSLFMYNVYRNACKIPYGETKIYKDIAFMVGTPKGARAVGQALKKNPLCILIPCHRVVAVNGLGGFNSGIDMKKYLLDLEQGQRIG